MRLVVFIHNCLHNGLHPREDLRKEKNNDRSLERASLQWECHADGDGGSCAPTEGDRHAEDATTRFG